MKQPNMLNKDHARSRVVALLTLMLLSVVTGCATPAPMTPPVAEATATPTQVPQPTGIMPSATPAPADSSTPEIIDMPTVPAPTATPVPEASAQYELTFESTWSAETHPTDFPVNPHFSDLIGSVHSPDAVIWAVGGLASPGMKSMAETGGTRLLGREITDLIETGTACSLITGDGIPQSPGRTKVSFTADVGCSQITIVTMVAPSPDWFVGVTGLNLLENGRWADQIVIELLPWDAGTDSGTSYTSPNVLTEPQESITVIADLPFLIGDSISPLGTLTITRLPDTN